MPKHKDFEHIYQNFLNQFGEKDGKARYYAWLNSRGLKDTQSAKSQKDKFMKREIHEDEDDTWADTMFADMLDEVDECLGYVGPIEKNTRNNTDFRHVLYTTLYSQLVLMSLEPGEDIGEEVHNVDQFFRFEAGEGIVVINDEEYPVEEGDAVVVPAGSRHNVIAKQEGLKLYTIYSPPEHKDGLQSHTKADALANDIPFDGQTTEVMGTGTAGAALPTTMLPSKRPKEEYYREADQLRGLVRRSERYWRYRRELPEE